VRDEPGPIFVEDDERREDFGGGVVGVFGGEASVFSWDRNDRAVSCVSGHASAIAGNVIPKSRSRLS
jgi:hypothetical protein